MPAKSAIDCRIWRSGKRSKAVRKQVVVRHSVTLLALGVFRSVIFVGTSACRARRFSRILRAAIEPL